MFIQRNDNIEIYYEENEKTKIRDIESWTFCDETIEETTRDVSDNKQ